MATPIPRLQQPLPERPRHERKQSSKSILFKALVSPVKSKVKDHGHEVSPVRRPVLGPAEEETEAVLGERSSNMRSPPRARTGHTRSKSMMDISKHTATRTETSREVLHLSKDKENATPRSSAEIRGRPQNAQEQMTPRLRKQSSPRKISDSSTDTMSAMKSLSIMKRGARVMAAVAAIQGKPVATPVAEPEKLVTVDVEARFEAMLSNRNVAPAMRDKMRNLTLRMKADLVKQEQEVNNTTSARTSTEAYAVEEEEYDENKSTKRSRPRSRTFTFSRGDRQADGSPSKKQRGRSRSRPAPIKTTSDTAGPAVLTPTTPRKSSTRGARSENPADYIAYLKNEQNPVKVEVGRLHKLRILLRNETVAWVDSFIAQDGLVQITGLLHRIITIEWREDHEDQLLHETLLCLKGLCTTESALTELSKYADELFIALLAMLFDDEKKGPAEYSTRAVIVSVLFAYLAAKLDNATELESRARTILSNLSKPKKSTSAPLDFVAEMQLSRPYKLWCREVTNVTREVFWIFLHHINVIPSPKTKYDTAEEQLCGSYTSRHFPGDRPPVPAAPYIGGVEWDATTYLTGHLDLMNGLIASLPTREARNALRHELQASGFEKTMGATLRTCKEKFYAGVHDGLRAWVAAAAEDGWPTLYVSEGPSLEEQAKSARASPKKSPTKVESAPKLDMPKLGLDLGAFARNDNDDWLG